MAQTQTIRQAGLVFLIGVLAGTGLQAQQNSLASAVGSEQSQLPLPDVVPPPRKFATAEAHYNYLLEEADGGTQHTMATIPVWSGLWESGNNSMPAIFLVDGTLAVGWSRGGIVKGGVLTPPYEAHFKARRAEIEEFGRQRYDRLTNCEYPGVPRWLWEPYIKEFVNMPQQSWLMNDMMNETRRVYIDKEHVNIDAQHSSTGDSIGFWDEDKLIIWTKWVNPADYVRGMPLTSNQFEMVESWEEVRYDNGSRQLVTQVTFYDPLALLEPQSAVYTHYPRPDLEEIGVRIRSWECSSSSNSYKDAAGDTQFYLPGDPEYKDPRGFTDFPELPGQSLNPIFDAAE
jgi:hypothetical protein